jgi:hypothetical protein
LFGRQPLLDRWSAGRSHANRSVDMGVKDSLTASFQPIGRVVFSGGQPTSYPLGDLGPLPWLSTTAADVVCLQETRADDEQLAAALAPAVRRPASRAGASTVSWPPGDWRRGRAPRGWNAQRHMRCAGPTTRRRPSTTSDLHTDRL